MFLELHLLQNFPPHCLNRDDTNAPKDCTFGGHRRARISSQCIKRAVRLDQAFRATLDDVEPAVRTRLLIREVAAAVDEKEKASEKTLKLVSEVFDAGGLEKVAVKAGQEETWVSKIQVFLDKAAIGRLASLILDARAKLEGKEGKAAKGDVAEALGRVLIEAAKVPEVALFGRMVAIDPKKPFGRMNLNVDAACQVAHALSTNRVAMEMDFFTAVDDLKDRQAEDSDAGAGMLGTVEFNSACFYRYANVDLCQLHKNLGGDAELTRKTAEAFLRASFAAIPTGKQNTFAAHSPPSFALAVVRERGLWNLANAFVKPVGSTHADDLVTGSVRRLDGYWKSLCDGLGTEGIKATAAFFLPTPGDDGKPAEPPLDALKDRRVGSVADLVKRAMAAVAFDDCAGGKGGRR